MRNRQPLPEKLANAPELPEWLVFYFSSFMDLTSCRSGGDGPIMWTAIDAYAIRYGVEEGDDYAYFKGVITGLDSAFLDYNRKKQDTKTPIGKGKKRGIGVKDRGHIRT